MNDMKEHLIEMLPQHVPYQPPKTPPPSVMTAREEPIMAAPSSVDSKIAKKSLKRVCVIYDAMVCAVR